MAATAEALGIRPVLEPDLLSQTATARRMGPQRFKEILRMAQRPEVQARFNASFPNIANNPKTQKDFERIRRNALEGDQIDCYDLLREAYGRPKLVEFKAPTSDIPLNRTMVVYSEHPIVDPANFIG